MSPEQKKAHKAAKKMEHDERKAHRTPEEQAKIDARVAKMQAALAASRAAKKAIQETGDEMPALVTGASV
jgi:4'-phosphopantetheinyl transferase EntD